MLSQDGLLRSNRPSKLLAEGHPKRISFCTGAIALGESNFTNRCIAAGAVHRCLRHSARNRALAFFYSTPVAR